MNLWCLPIYRSWRRPFDLFLHDTAIHCPEPGLSVDMIVIAARGEENLPSAVKKWIKMWGSQKRDNRCVLVGILSLRNKPYDKLPSTSSYLHKAARKAEMPFFWEPIYPSKNHFNFSKHPIPYKITNADREIDVINAPTDNYLEKTKFG